MKQQSNKENNENKSPFDISLKIDFVDYFVLATAVCLAGVLVRDRKFRYFLFIVSTFI